MATNLSSNNYVGEIPKVGDCVCVRGHKPIAMGELLAMSRSGPAGPTHAAQAPGHEGLGARPWRRRERAPSPRQSAQPYILLRQRRGIMMRFMR
jgi:hypothetical protein